MGEKAKYVGCSNETCETMSNYVDTMSPISWRYSDLEMFSYRIQGLHIHQLVQGWSETNKTLQVMLLGSKISPTYHLNSPQTPPKCVGLGVADLAGEALGDFEDIQWKN